MILIKLWGGMCNQMFQLAFGYALSKNHNDSLFIDNEFFKNQPSYVGYRKPLSIDNFPNLYFLKNVKKRSHLIKIFELRYLCSLLRHSFGFSLSLGNTFIFIEKLRTFYEKIPYKHNKTNYYDGYWAGVSYFESYRNDLLTLFQPNELILNRVIAWRRSIKSQSCVAIHIRRGDYLNNRNSKGLTSTEYYLKAIEIMKTHVNSPIFCFFSDDIEWCKNTFSYLNNSIFIKNHEENSDIIDLFSISLCDHGIMSNSTFSWWGNWLRRSNKDSVVICPSISVSNNYYIPKEWIVI